MLRQLFVGLAVAMSTVVVAPATAQVSNSSALDMPMTRVSELANPISSQEVKETEEQFPKVSELEEIEEATGIQPARLEVTTGTSKERSQTESVEPEYEFASSLKFEPSQPKLEPSRVNDQNKSVAVNNIIPFNSKQQVVEPSRVSNQPVARNNIISFSKERLVNQVEPSQPVVQTTRIQPDVVSVVTTLETSESLSRNVGTSYPNSTPKTAFSLDRALTSTPVTALEKPRRTHNIVTGDKTKNVRTVSTRAVDLGGTVTVQQPQPVVVETQEQVQSEPKPKPTGSLSVGVTGIGGSPVLETAAQIEYDGFSASLSFNHPLDGRGQDTIGLATTLPISDKAKLTVKADQINIDPTISAAVESNITERLTASASFNTINRPDFNVELAATYKIDQHWSARSSLNMMTRQLNIGATYASRGVEATIKVDTIADIPQLGVGLGLELSSSSRLELSGSNLTTEPTFGVKVTQSF
jgi:hypothetical protein